MRSESVTVHKGGREERYKIYVEDYVIAYLKFQADTLEMSEIFFYGYDEREQNKIVIYGAGKNKQLAVFDKYVLLEKVACRLTQAGPVFMIREKEELYEVRGYDIFYHENTEMQNYMIECKQQDAAAVDGHAHCGAVDRDAEPADSHLHYTLTLQLGVIFVILVAIVINSTNSYDRMEQLNQSAKEVFFALENQEAETSMMTGAKTADVEEVPEDAAVTADTQQSAESGEETSGVEQSADKVEETSGVGQSADKVEETAVTDQLPENIEETVNADQEADDKQTDTDEAQQEAEALSRNVVRYYEIERGDTLYTISKEIYGDTSKVQQICDLNQIKDPDDIRYGQKIILP
jgi:LysM repeat protein